MAAGQYKVVHAVKAACSYGVSRVSYVDALMSDHNYTVHGAVNKLGLLIAGFGKSLGSAMCGL